MPLSKISTDAFGELLGLHARLSPENLCGDGEIPEIQWRRTQRDLLAQVEAIRVREGLTTEEVQEEAVYSEHARRGPVRSMRALR